MRMKFVGRNQVVFDLDFSATHGSPGPFRMIVRGFSRYRTTVESLPILEKIRLVVTADFIAESFRLGSLPIVSAKIIGHADFDAQLGRVSSSRLARHARRTWSETSARVSIG
jgi:hypothetical protein